MSKSRWVVHVGVVGAVLVTAWLSLSPEPAPTAIPSATFDCRPQAIARISPGTRIADGPPSGWTHLVSKTLPELPPRDAEKLHARAAELARLLFTALVARVGRHESPQRTVYRLEELAAGLGTKIGQEDVIISSKTQGELGANFGFLERLVLAGAEKELDRIVIRARSDTSLIVDMPTTKVLDGQHRLTVLRYVYMVDPHDGRLESVVWRIDLDSKGDYARADLAAVRRYLGRVEPCQLHVDARQTIAGIPKPSAFATIGMPSGDPVALPPALEEIAGQRELTPPMAEQIDMAVRRAIGLPPGM